MSSVKLTAYGLPLEGGNGTLEHTYVVSGSGAEYGCFGRSAEGRFLVEGYGDDQVADCHAGPQSYAGIFYGVTGVCHQAANRIMSSTVRVVADAPNFVCSSFIFTHYGLPWDREAFGHPKPDWVEDWADCFARCRQPNPPLLPRAPKQPSKRMKNGPYTSIIRKNLRTFKRNQVGLIPTHEEIIGLYRDQLNLLIRFGMSWKKARKYQDDIVREGIYTYENRADLTRAWFDEEIDDAEFHRQLGELIQASQRHVREAVPLGAYVDMFQTGINQTTRLVDPNQVPPTGEGNNPNHPIN